MSLVVTNGGLLTTVQDLGRKGFLSQGILGSGVMDSISSRIANLLVGNEEEEAVLEMTMIGAKFHSLEHLIVAVTGGGMEPVINGEPFPLARAIHVPPQSEITFKSKRKGCRAYLAISGGIDVPIVLNSRSTYLRAGIGGFEGRALKKGDIIEVKNPPIKAQETSIQSVKERNHLPLVEKWGVRSSQLDNNSTIRIFPGTHYDLFTSESKRQLFYQPYGIDNQSDRMGYRLNAKKTLALKEPFNLLSEAVTFGTIQVPPEGFPIILMADRQTTGGYPRIAQVAAVDLGKLAQLKPADSFKFQKITCQEAERLYFNMEEDFRILKTAIALKSG